MFGNKKQLQELNEQISHIQSRVVEHTDALTQQHKAVREMGGEAKTALCDLNNTRKELRGTTILLQKEISQINDEFSRALDQIKLQHRDFEQRVLEQLRSALQENLNTLRADSSRYKDLRDELNQTREDLILARAEIRNMREISSSLKKEDFEATQFAKKVYSSDREKLRLMQENEKLKGIIAKRRRNPRR